MNFPAPLIKALLLWTILVVAGGIGRLALLDPDLFNPRVIGWQLAADAIVAATLTLLAYSSRRRGWPLALSLTGALSGVAVLNLVEGVVYLESAVGNPLWHVVFVTTRAILILPWALAFGWNSNAKNVEPGPTLPFASCVWRFIACDFLYLVLYFAAGILIYPLVREFYSSHAMPSPATIVTLQLLVRGPAFVAICLVLSRLIEADRKTTAVLTGLSFAILSGIAPLLVPNRMFPDEVRWIHLAEVGVSNFLFGSLVSLVWSKRGRASSSSLQPA